MKTKLYTILIGLLMAVFAQQHQYLFRHRGNLRQLFARWKLYQFVQPRIRGLQNDP